MSKQDIEKRLGFAAQGVKETTRTSAKAKFVRFMDLETWKNSKGTVFTAGIEDDAGRFQPYVTARDSSGGDQLQTRSAPTFKTEKGARKWLNTWMQNHKSTSSRPGVKAKMAKPQFRTKKLHNGYIAVEVNQGSGWERYDTTHEESWNGIEEYERGYQKAYDRGLRYSGGAWRIPSTTASRPGVKAKMASGWSGKTAKLNRYGDFAVVAAGEDGYAKGFANRTQAQAFSDKHNLGGVKFPSSGGRSFYVFVEAPKDSESTTAARPGMKAKA